MTGTVLCFLVDAIQLYVWGIGIKQVGKVGSLPNWDISEWGSYLTLNYIGNNT